MTLQKHLGASLLIMGLPTVPKVQLAGGTAVLEIST